MKTTKTFNERIWLSVSVVLLLYVLVLYIPQIAMNVIGIRAPGDDLINFVIYFIFWFWVIPFGLKIPMKVSSFSEYLSILRLNHISPSNLMFGIGLGCLYLVILAFSSFIAGSFSINFQSILPPKNWILLYGNIGAFFEEVAIRGAIFLLLAKKYNKNQSIFLSAIIFGVGHIITYFLGNELFDSIIQVTYAFSLGLLFAALFSKTGSLITSIATHMMINSFSQIFQGSYSNDTYTYMILGTSILTTMIGLLLLKYFPENSPLRVEETAD